MRAPSPESSCHSSDCEGDKVVHAMKRMRIEERTEPVLTVTSSGQSFARKSRNASGARSPMLVDTTTSATSCEKEDQRRKKMLELLQNQLRQYKSQYSMITEGLDIAPCG